MTAYRELIERLKRCGTHHQEMADLLEQSGSPEARVLWDRDASMCFEAAAALRALEAQSKDKEEGEA